MSEIFENSNKLSILSEAAGVVGDLTNCTAAELCGLAASMAANGPSSAATIESVANAGSVLSCSAKFVTLDAGPRQRV